MIPVLHVPCAKCGGTDYSTPRAPFRHAGWAERTMPDGSRERFHFDCEAEAAREGKFRKINEVRRTKKSA